MSADSVPPPDPGVLPAEASAEPWQWPCCPACGRRRQTRCPTCDIGGDDFSLAEYLPTLEPPATLESQETLPPIPQDLLLMCPACDEAFSPAFYRHCQQCGYDFGQGLVLDATEGDDLTGRALIVLAGLVGLAVAIMAYFWWLFA